MLYYIQGNSYIHLMSIHGETRGKISKPSKSANEHAPNDDAKKCLNGRFLAHRSDSNSTDLKEATSVITSHIKCWPFCWLITDPPQISLSETGQKRIQFSNGIL